MLPGAPASIFEGEAELGVIIGKTASHVPEAEAMQHVFGYVNFIDGSARGLPPPQNVFFQMKSRDSFAPIGPSIVTADEITDPQNLEVELEIEGLGRLSIDVRDDLKRRWAPTTRLEHRAQGGEGPFTPQLSGKYARPS